MSAVEFIEEGMTRFPLCQSSFLLSFRAKWSDSFSGWVAAILVVILGRWLAVATRRWLASAFKRTTLTPSMESLFLTLAYYSVWILAMMLALIIMGVPAVTVVTVVGVVIIVLGIALQQSCAIWQPASTSCCSSPSLSAT